MKPELPTTVTQHPDRAAKRPTHRAVRTAGGAPIADESQCRGGELEGEVLKRRLDIRQAVGGLKNVALAEHTTRGPELDKVISQKRR